MLGILVFGALGGTARGLVGYTKYFTSYKNVKFSWTYFGMTVGVSAAVGLLVVWAIADAGITFADTVGINPALAAIIGYAGGDAMENVYKIILREPILGQVKK